MRAHPAKRRTVLEIAALAAVYILLAKLGLSLGVVAGFATLVWPPTGLALATLLLLGSRLWRGVFLGAGLVNVWAGAPLAVALAIGSATRWRRCWASASYGGSRASAARSIACGTSSV